MPRIFDNIANDLLPALTETLKSAHRADFCVGFFNLRGWRMVSDQVEQFAGGDDRCCRVLIGMNERPDEELRAALRIMGSGDSMDMQRSVQLRGQVAAAFRDQLMRGAPTNRDEQVLRQLAQQLRAGKVQVKLHLRYNLHAKLYLLFREDYNNPITGYLGSSNLTMAGLRAQGELNTDVLDHSATKDLERWFNDRWSDRWSLDISEDLAGIIEESWAREELVPPYLVYLKMVYHMSQEARTGLNEFTLPRDFRGKLFPFQEAAVKIAARHVNQRGGVLLGDVVGLGKTMMATALARIFKDDFGWRPLIICPKNLVTMWQQYNLDWDMGAEIIPLSKVQQTLAKQTRRFRLMILDESHTLRNREGKRYKAIRDYIQEFDCKVVLLSATPYNKSYLDLSAQLRLFVPEDADLGIRPEAFIRGGGEDALLREQVPPRSLRAFEHSDEADDWRELMRLYMVRRTRSFIKDNYAELDAERQRSFLTLSDGRRYYFPERVPKTVPIAPAADGSDPYSKLYDAPVVETINQLTLPRYGLSQYLRRDATKLASATEKVLIENLGRARQRLLGFCRTNLFKRLESGGEMFLQSLDRHVLRNYVFLHALAGGLPLPIGTQGAEVLNTESDADIDSDLADQLAFDEGADVQPDAPTDAEIAAPHPLSAAWYAQRAAAVYATYAKSYKTRFKWLGSKLFTPTLQRDLQADADALLAVIQAQGAWNPAQDTKLHELIQLLQAHPDEKFLIFTQFADTVDYLVRELRAAGIAQVEGVTGQSANPTELAQRFSPVSNNIESATIRQNPIRVLVATDVLSEGQNLQDACRVVNYDLPWAIIRLIQRAGRVDRIGQLAPTITCYTFLPADGIEQIIRLRARVRQRLTENGEVVGSDEQFFEDGESQILRNLYTETSGALDDRFDDEVDLASYAFQIWQNAIRANPPLKAQIEGMPNVVYSAKALPDLSVAGARSPVPFAMSPGVLVYLRTAGGNDALVWVDQRGQSVTQSQSAILRAAACELTTPAVPRAENHHELVQESFQLVEQHDMLSGGLGSVRGARYRLYDALKRYQADLKQYAPLLLSDELSRLIDDVYRYPLQQAATDTINRQIRSGSSDEQLADLAMALRNEDKLSIIYETAGTDTEPQIVCSLGLI